MTNFTTNSVCYFVDRIKTMRTVKEGTEVYFLFKIILSRFDLDLFSFPVGGLCFEK